MANPRFDPLEETGTRPAHRGAISSNCGAPGRSSCWTKTANTDAEEGDEMEQSELAKMVRQLLPLLPLLGVLDEEEIRSLAESLLDDYGKDELLSCARIAEAAAARLRTAALAFPGHVRTGT